MPPRPREFHSTVAPLIPKLLTSLCGALATIGPSVANDRPFWKRCASVGVQAQMTKAGFRVDAPSEANCDDGPLLLTLQREAIRGTFIGMPDYVIDQLPPAIISDYEELLTKEHSVAPLVDPLELVKSRHQQPTIGAEENTTLAGTKVESSTEAATSSSTQATTKDTSSSPGSVADELRRRLVVWQGDMSILKADAVVNPANNALLGCFLPSHRCLDNILHAESGPKLRLACRDMLQSLSIEEDANGQCRVTDAFCLPSTYVFHTVGPDLNLGRGRVRKPTDTDRQELKSSYRKCLSTAIDMGLKSIAFCCISTGVFAYPAEEAAQLAVAEVMTVLSEALESRKGLKVSDLPIVVFNVFKDEDLAIYQKLLPDQ